MEKNSIELLVGMTLTGYASLDVCMQDTDIFCNKGHLFEFKKLGERNSYMIWDSQYDYYQLLYGEDENVKWRFSANYAT